MELARFRQAREDGGAGLQVLRQRHIEAHRNNRNPSNSLPIRARERDTSTLQSGRLLSYLRPTSIDRDIEQRFSAAKELTRGVVRWRFSAAFVMRSNWARPPWRATACSISASLGDEGAHSLDARLLRESEGQRAARHCA
jgi:hypothetical protein